MFIRSIFILLFSVSLFGNDCTKSPIDSIFYQPHLKDDGEIDLDKSMKMLSQLGIKQLILQWSKHGVVDFTLKDNYIQNILISGQKYNVKIVFGLYADDKYFKVIDNIHTNFERYFNTLKKENIAQAKRVYAIAKKYDSFDGWYIYDEIDDKHFRAQEIQTYLKNYLVSLADSLDKISVKDIHMSCYFTGQMDPKDFSLMLTYITQNRYIVMPQSGIGAGLLNAVESKIYMKEFSKYYDFNYMPIAEIFNIDFTSVKSQIDMLQKTTNKKKLNAFSLRYFIEDEFIKQYESEYCKL